MKPVFTALRKYALGFPGTREDLPWGESAIKAGGKTFLFISDKGARFYWKIKGEHPGADGAYISPHVFAHIIARAGGPFFAGLRRGLEIVGAQDYFNAGAGSVGTRPPLAAT